MKLYKPPKVSRFFYTMRPDGDKSVAHRGILLASISDGPSRLHGIPRSEDVKRTISSIRALGVSVVREGPDLVIAPGRGRELKEPKGVISCGNSGTTMRLLAGLLSAGGGLAVLTGDASLNRRPMNRIIIPLREMGAEIYGRDHDRYPPLVLIGRPLRPIEYELPIPSAQVKTAIILAGLLGGVMVTLREPVRSRDHMEIMLRDQGVGIVREGEVITLRPPPGLGPLHLHVPGDISSAAFFIVLAVLSRAGRIRVKDVLLNPTRTRFIEVLRRMGARIEVREGGEWNGEVVGDVTAYSSELHCTAIGEDDAPSINDEVPALAIAASRAEGETLFSDLEELRYKESDRISAVARNLRGVGVDVDERPDGFLVRGSRGPLRGLVRSWGDHRVAMAFSILGALPRCDLAVSGIGCVGSSFPDFFRHLELAASGAGGVKP